MRQLDCDFIDDGAGTPAHDQDSIRQGHRFGEIVGDQQRRLVRRFERLRQVVLQHHARLCIDRRERLVEQENVRIDRKRARQRHPLAHAARQLMRVMPGEFGQLEVRQQSRGAAFALGYRHALNFDAEHDVLGNGAPRQQQIFLQHEGDLRIGACDSLAVDEGGAVARRGQPRADIEKRALAAATRADQRHHLFVVNGKAHGAHGRKRPVALGIRETHRHVAVFEADNSHFRSSEKRAATCDGFACVLSLELLNYTVKSFDREGYDKCASVLAYPISAARFGLRRACCSVRLS